MRRLPMKVHLLILLLLSGLLAGVFVNVQSFDGDKLNRVHSLLERLNRLDAETEQFMLQIVNHSMFDYDALTDDVTEMREIFGKLQHELADEPFQPILNDLGQSLATQYRGIDAFKSAFAIWSNSSRYLPILTQQLIAQHPDQTLTLLTLNKEIFEWQLHPDNDQLRTSLQMQAESVRANGLEKLYEHVHILLTYGEHVYDAISLTTTCGTPEHASLLSDAYDRYFAKALEEKKRNESLLIILAVVLLAYLLMLLIFRKLDAQQLAESEKRFRLLFELIPDAVGIHRNGRWVYCNPAAVKLFGANSEDDLIGTKVIDRVHPEMREAVSKRIQREFKEGEAAPLMVQKHLRLDGSIFYSEVQGIPFKDNGQLASMVVARDVSDRIAAEDKANRLITILEHTSDFVGMADADGRVLYVNPAGKRLVGLPLNCDEQKMRISDFHPTDENARMFAEILPDAVAHGSIRTETRFLHRNGHEIATSAVFTAHIDPGSGRASHYSVIARDLTEEIERNKQLEHTQRLESLGILAGGIAHDFNNILTAIMGNAAMAKRCIEPNSPALQQLARIETSTQRASDLCRQMLAYSGKGKFVVKPVNLSDMVC